MPHDLGAVIKSKAVHAIQALERKVRHHEPRSKDKKLRRESSKVDTNKVRLDVDEKKIKADVEKMLRAERVANYPWGEPEEMVRVLAMKPKAKDQDDIRRCIFRHADTLVAAAFKRAGSSHTPSEIIRKDLGECLNGYNSRQLKTIIRNAVQANAPTLPELKAGWDKKAIADPETQRTRDVMKLVVEACLDRLREKNKYTPLSECLPKTDRYEILYAWRQWVVEPGKKLVESITRGGSSSPELMDLIRRLVPGYKAFGGDRIRSALLEDFRAANSWSHDQVIDEIGRRAAALKEVATTKDLYVTALVMEEVYKAYHLAKMARSVSLPLAMAHLQAAPPPKPSAADRAWAHIRQAVGQTDPELTTRLYAVVESLLRKDRNIAPIEELEDLLIGRDTSEIRNPLLAAFGALPPQNFKQLRVFGATLEKIAHDVPAGTPGRAKARGVAELVVMIADANDEAHKRDVPPRSTDEAYYGPVCRDLIKKYAEAEESEEGEPLERDRRVAPEAAPRADRKPPSDKGKEREVEAEAPVEPTTPEIAQSSAPSPEVEAMMQALREGRNINGLIGPLEVLAAKLDSPDFRSTRNSLVAAFRNSRRPFDLSRLKEFGATLQEVAYSNSTMKGFDKALQVARGAITVAEAADSPYGRPTPGEANEEVWGRLCDGLLRKYTAAARNENSLSATIERTFNAIETMNVTEYCEALRRINETDAEQGSEQASAMVNGAFVQAIRRRSDGSLSILKNNSGKVHELLGRVLSERNEKNRPIFSDAEELLSMSQALKEWLEDPIEQSGEVVENIAPVASPAVEPTQPGRLDRKARARRPVQSSGPTKTSVPDEKPLGTTQGILQPPDEVQSRQQQIRHIAEEASDTSPRQAKPRHLPRRFQRKRPAEPVPNQTSVKPIAPPDDAGPAEPQQPASVPPLVLPTAVGEPEQQPEGLSPRNRSGQPWNRTTPRWPRSPRRSDLPANSESQSVVMPTPAASPASSEARPQSLRRTMAQAQPPRVKLVQSSGRTESNRRAGVSPSVSDPTPVQESAPVSNSDGILAAKAVVSAMDEKDFGRLLSALKVLGAEDVDRAVLVREVLKDRKLEINTAVFRRFDWLMYELDAWVASGTFDRRSVSETSAIFSTWGELKRGLWDKGFHGNPMSPFFESELNKAKDSLIKLYPGLAFLDTAAPKNRVVDPVAPITEARPTIDERFDDADEDSEDGAEPADKSSGPEGKSIYDLFEDALSADDSSTGKTPARRLVTKEAQDGYNAIRAEIEFNRDAPSLVKQVPVAVQQSPPLSDSDRLVLTMRAQKLATAIGKPNFYSFYLELEALNRLQHIKGKDRVDAITKAMKDKQISIEQLRRIDGIANNTLIVVGNSSRFATEAKIEIGQVMNVWAVIKTEANIGVASMSADRSVVRKATKALEEHYRDNFAPEMESDDDGPN